MCTCCNSAKAVSAVCRMAEGLDTDEEEEAEASPSASHVSEAYSHDPESEAPRRFSAAPQPAPHSTHRPERHDAASKDLEREIAAALAADAAFLEDPSMSLRDGALQPLEMGQEESFELPALSAGGTISKVGGPT